MKTATVSKPAHWHHESRDLKRELRDEVDRDLLRSLHRIRPSRHFLILARQLILIAGCAFICWRFDDPLLWIPAAILQGFNLFNFSVLLHEQVHHCIFARKRPRLERFFGLFYGTACGLSASQFTRWHLDHHRGLGTTDLDPKRHHLSPKINARWLKLLYATPALFFIYFRAARREVATYPEALQRTIAKERRAAIAFHLLIAALLVATGAWALALRVHLIPYFLFFPPAFALNRVGQHYDIVPEDSARWSTRVDGNPIWRFLFLASNHHLEHHWFPTVPFYELARLNRSLHPFFARKGIPNRGYGEILYGWILRNRVPHSRWEEEKEPS